MTKRGWTCIAEILHPFLYWCLCAVFAMLLYTSLPNFCFVSSPLMKKPKPADSSFSIISSECLWCTHREAIIKAQLLRTYSTYVWCDYVHTYVHQYSNVITCMHVTIPLVGITSCNELDIFLDGFTIESSVTHDLLDQFNSIRGIGFIKKQDCVQTNLLIFCSNHLNMFNKVSNFLFCYTTVNLGQLEVRIGILINSV